MKLSKELAKYYYTAAQARKVLGLDEEAFQYWIRKGRVKRVSLPGRVQGVYSRREVDEIARRTEAAILSEQPEGTEFRKATLDDLRQESQLAHLLFGEKAEAYNERRAFLQKNSEIDYHVYDQDKLVAYIILLPLSHEMILDFIEGKIKNIWTIQTDNIEPFVPGKPLEVLIVDMGTTPTVPPLKRGTYGSRLLNGLLGVLAEMGRRGIYITKVYATSRTTSGIRILKKAGFEVVHDFEDGRFSFELDVLNADEKILKDYQEAVEYWKTQKKSTDRKSKSREQSDF